MVTLSFVNNKGGVAKTSSTANVGAFLAYNEYKVLLIDNDPQANLSQNFNLYDQEKNISDAYTKLCNRERDVKLPLVKLNKNLFIVPGSNKLNDIEKNMISEPGREYFLKRLLTPLEEHFDFCLVDCPPSLGILTTNSVVTCNGVIIPIEASVFSLNGVKSIMQYLDDLKYSLNAEFDLTGVFMAKYDIRNSISSHVKQEVIKYFKEKMFKTDIRINVAIANAQAEGQDIFYYSKNSNASLDYGNLTDEIIKRINHKAKKS